MDILNRVILWFTDYCIERGSLQGPDREVCHVIEGDLIVELCKAGQPLRLTDLVYQVNFTGLPQG
jgi:hypothetical protein